MICEICGIREGDRLRVEGETVFNETTGSLIAAEPLPPVMRQIIEAGGLVPYFRQHGGFPAPEII